jgi:hypothetical protein
MEHCNDIILQTHLTNLQYFFSTVTQVLGAILAITGAFVVFNLDKLRISLNGVTQLVLDRFRRGVDEDGVYRSVFDNKELEEFREAKLQGNIEEIKSIIQGKFKAVEEENEFNEDKGKRLEGHFSEVIKRVERIKEFQTASRLTYLRNGAILAFLIAMFLIIPCVYRSTCGYWITIVSGLGLTILSLCLIIRFLIKSL